MNDHNKEQSCFFTFPLSSCESQRKRKQSRFSLCDNKLTAIKVVLLRYFYSAPGAYLLQPHSQGLSSYCPSGALLGRSDVRLWEWRCIYFWFLKGERLFFFVWETIALKESLTAHRYQTCHRSVGRKGCVLVRVDHFFTWKIVCWQPVFSLRVTRTSV